MNKLDILNFVGFMVLLVLGCYFLAIISDTIVYRGVGSESIEYGSNVSCLVNEVDSFCDGFLFYGSLTKDGWVSCEFVNGSIRVNYTKPFQTSNSMNMSV